MSELHPNSGRDEGPYTAFTPEGPSDFDSAEARRQLVESGAMTYKEAVETPNSLLKSEMARLEEHRLEAGDEHTLSIQDALDDDGNFDSAKARRALVDAGVLTYKEAAETPNTLLRSKFESAPSVEKTPQTEIMEAAIEDIQSLQKELDETRARLNSLEERLAAYEARSLSGHEDSVSETGETARFAVDSRGEATDGEAGDETTPQVSREDIEAQLQREEQGLAHLEANGADYTSGMNNEQAEAFIAAHRTKIAELKEKLAGADAQEAADETSTTPEASVT
jgi:polyhydroxyalkanoate synthesis regulator phasin